MLPHRSHITKKRAVFYYRRRLPNTTHVEIAVSLRTSSYREAGHYSAMIDEEFETMHGNAVIESRRDTTPKTVGEILRGYINHMLDIDKRQRTWRLPGEPLYANREMQSLGITDDLTAIRRWHSEALQAHINFNPSEYDLQTARLLSEYNAVQETMHPNLLKGLLEANIEIMRVFQARTEGHAPVFVAPPAPPSLPIVQPTMPPAPKVVAAPKIEAKPVTSSLIDAFFEHRLAKRITHQVMSQERKTLRVFIELCGDRPIDTYTRSDTAKMLETFRKLPGTYGKSAIDKASTIAEIIARAPADKPRLTDKSVKRHLSVLSQFLLFAWDNGHITKIQRDEIVTGFRFVVKKSARNQRDAWTMDELQTLFASPVWAGHAAIRSKPGPTIKRDAMFWLPILALYHGARLEEFADLGARDIEWMSDGWFFHIREGDRRLKNKNAARSIPMHPEMIRLGFIDYVRSIAPTPTDPLFPDIEIQGADKKRGPRITRWFVNYRRQIGIYRPGVAMHAFRHVANTRLTDIIVDEQDKRALRYLMGHSAGTGEGDARYDKGPGRTRLVALLSKLSYPELDFSQLYSS